MARGGRGGRGGSRGGSRTENSNRSQKSRSRKSQSSGSLHPDSNTATKPPAKLIDLNEVTMGEFMAAYGPKPKPQRKRRQEQEQQPEQGQQTTASEKKKLAPSAIKREQRRKQAMMSQIGGPLDSNNLFEKDYTLEDMECFMRGAFFPSKGRRFLRRNRNQRKAAASTISAPVTAPDAQLPPNQTDGSDNSAKTGTNRFLKQKERRENFLKFRQQALSDIENLKIADLEKRNQEMAQQILERSKQQKFDDNKRPIVEPNLAFVDPVNQIEIKIDKNQENKKVFCRTFSFLPRQGRRLKKKKKKKTKVGSASTGNSSLGGGGGGGAPPGGGNSPSKNNFNESNAGGPNDGSGGSGGGGAGGGSKLAQNRSFFHGVNVRSVPTGPTSDGGGTTEQNTAIPPPMDGVVRRKSSVQNQISGGFNRTTAETEMMVGEMDRAQQQQQGQQSPILQVLPPGSNMDQIQAPVSYSPYLVPNEYQTVVNPVPGVGSSTWSAAQLGPDDKERISSSTKKPKNSKPPAQKTLPQTTPQKPMAMLPGQLRLPKGAGKGKRPVPLPRTDLLSGQSRVLSNALSRTTTSMSSATTSTTTNRSSLNSATPSVSSTSTPVGFGDVNSSIVGSFTSNSPTSTTTGTTNSLKSNKPKKKQLNYETKSLDSKRIKHHNQAKNTPTRKNAKK